MFQLIDSTAVRLAHINLRQEKHGKQKVSAMDLDFVREGDRFILEMLDSRLPWVFFHDPDAGQDTVDGAAPRPFKPQFPRINTFPWNDEGAGFDLVVIYGLGDERSSIELRGGKVIGGGRTVSGDERHPHPRRRSRHAPQARRVLPRQDAEARGRGKARHRAAMAAGCDDGRGEGGGVRAVDAGGRRWRL